MDILKFKESVVINKVEYYSPAVRSLYLLLTNISINKREYYSPYLISLYLLLINIFINKWEEYRLSGYSGYDLR